MRKQSFVVFFLFLGSVLLPFSCSKSETKSSYKVGLVSGFGGFSDRGFNQNIYEGFIRAGKDFSLDYETFEIFNTPDFDSGIQFFLKKGFNLIVTAGYDASQGTIDAAIANPGVDFLILDYAMTSPPANLQCAVFDVDQSSFPCGFLAAYMAYRQNHASPSAGYVAGPEIPEIRQFSVSYEHGINYFNTRYRKNVQCKGYYASSFADTLQGAKLADSLIKAGTTVIFAFAGKTGNGALYETYNSGKIAIGVDIDQYISIPQVGPALLTSCMKGLDVMVYNVMSLYAKNFFAGGSVLHGTLENLGVGLAPFHDFVEVIPDSIKTSIAEIKTGIINGTIQTGWPE